MKKTVLPILLLLTAAIPAISAYKLTKISGDNQLGVAGYPLQEDFVVRIANEDDTSAVHQPVVFSVVYQPTQP